MHLRTLWLPLSVVIFFLSGCTANHQPINPFPKPITSEKKQDIQLKAKQVHLYKTPTELLRLPFRDLGEVSGEDCQKEKNDKPASLDAARKMLQLHAAEIQANAVLVHLCKIRAHHPQCYQQARCQGSALLVSQ